MHPSTNKVYIPACELPELETNAVKLTYCRDYTTCDAFYDAIEIFYEDNNLDNSNSRGTLHVRGTDSYHELRYIKPE